MWKDEIIAVVFAIFGIELFFWMEESFIIITGLSVEIYLVAYFITGCFMYANLKLVSEGTYLQNNFKALIWLSALWMATSLACLLERINHLLQKIKSQKALSCLAIIYLPRYS
ncbi:MAG: hypothetical protein KAI72_10025 [Candidatus Pacebacteria bacterium]|nr:hypothetical protein [Candidatus Paceibacterota bacterium]